MHVTSKTFYKEVDHMFYTFLNTDIVSVILNKKLENMNSKSFQM